MVKVAITTVVEDRCNFGQRLQAYALCRYMRKNFDVDARVIDCRNTVAEPIQFAEFQKLYIPTLHATKLTDLLKFNPDLVVLGSDQILNAEWFDISQCWHSYLRFARKIISYSASAGNNAKSVFFGNNKAKTLQILKKLKAISVRETYLQAFLQENGLDVQVDIDPVFLLSKNEWMHVANKPESIDSNSIFDFEYNLDNEPFKAMQQDDGSTRFICNGNFLHSNVLPPQEFIWMVANCRKLYTRSYHGLCFAAIFNKDAVVSNLHEDGRMLSLQQLVGIASDGNKPIFNQATSNRIDELKKNSYQYLSKHLPQSTNMCGSLCTACMACKESCQHNAISSEMVNGFRHLIVDKAKCISCRKCADACPTPTYSRHAVSAYVAANSHQLSCYASSGFVSEAAKAVVEAGGVTYGIKFTDGCMSCEWSRATTVAEVLRQAGSKYIEPPEIPWKSIAEDIAAKKRVLFVGLPCQTAAICKKFKDSRLVVVSLVCNSVPSAERWKNHVEKLQQLHGSAILHVDMKHGQRDFLYSFVDGSRLVVKPQDNEWLGFLKSTSFIRQSCVCCQHKYPRIHGDLIVGDAWGFDVAKDGKKASLILALSEKGKMLISKLDQMQYTDVSNIWENICRKHNPALFYGR